MRFLLIMPDGCYVRKGDGTNDFVRDPREATRFDTKESAEAGKPGHHRDMGGTGFKGRIVDAQREISSWLHRNGESQRLY